jgi:hypothetical protein
MTAVFLSFLIASDFVSTHNQYGLQVLNQGIYLVNKSWKSNANEVFLQYYLSLRKYYFDQAYSENKR